MTESAPEVNTTRCERLRQVMKEQRITQKQLADILGVTQQSISKMVLGKSNVTEKTVDILAKTFPSYDYFWLLGHESCRAEEVTAIKALLFVCAARQNRRMMEAGIYIDCKTFQRMKFGDAAAIVADMIARMEEQGNGNE